MSINLRSMAIASIEDFVSYMKTYNKGNDYAGDQYRDGEYLITPMLKIKLVIKVRFALLFFLLTLYCKHYMLILFNFAI